MSELKRTKEEIEAAIKRAQRYIVLGDRYAAGVRDAIDWLLGDWFEEDGPILGEA